MLREVRLKKDDHSISPLAAITDTPPELTVISTDDDSPETIIGININTISVDPPKPKEVQL